MRTKMTFIMAALQVVSVVLIIVESNSLAVVCFLSATAGVLISQALNK